MKTYILRTVYAVANLQFANEIILRRGETQIQFIRRRELPSTKYKMVSTLPDGKRKVQVSTINRLHQGSPLLLEIVTSCTADDNATPFDVRPILETQTARAAGCITWSWPGVMGSKLGDGLFFKQANEETWTWFDAEPLQITDCYEAPEKLSAALADTEQRIAALPSEQQPAAEAAVRWWQQSHGVESPADRLVAFWIILEIVASALFSENSIHERVVGLLLKEFPNLAVIDNGGLIRKMEKVLSAARNRAVHGGKRDLAEPNATVLVAQYAARASISFFLGCPVTAYPPRELLETLGIKIT